MLACVAATFLTPVLLHAYDNDAQLRARQALEEKMKELDTQSTTSAPPAMVTQPKPAATKAKRQKTAASPKSANPTMQAPQAQKPASPDILVTPGQPPQQMPPPQTAPNTAPHAVSQPAPVVSAPAPTQSAPATTPNYSTPPSTSSANTEQTENLRNDMRAQMMQQQAVSGASNAPGQTSQPWNAPYTPPQSQSKQKHVARSATPSQQPAPNLPPLAAPATGLSAAKQQKLDQLLQLYRADQITPQEYHDQRAKILAGP